jgi:hypothetical protein
VGWGFALYFRCFSCFSIPSDLHALLLFFCV